MQNLNQLRMGQGQILRQEAFPTFVLVRVSLSALFIARVLNFVPVVLQPETTMRKEALLSISARWARVGLQQHQMIHQEHLKSELTGLMGSKREGLADTILGGDVSFPQAIHKC